MDARAILQPIQLADIDGDGADELLGRSAAGMRNYEFTPDPTTPFVGTWSALPVQNFLTDAGDYNQANRYRTIQLGDIDGDGKEELIIRSNEGIRTYRFDTSQNHWVFLLLGPALSNANGWNNEEFYSTIQFADIDGDGSQELLARAAAGMRVFRWQEPLGWDDVTPFDRPFPNSEGWSDP